MSQDCDCIQYSNFKTSFLKNENQFLGESTAIERTSLPYKTASSETNIKVNEMGNTK